MTVYIFTGPTLAPSDARGVLEAIYLPPAAQGDVYRVARERPDAIGIIDGYFDTLPAVWHKEILWAMHEGVPVFGSASMGALRAAELAAFGMLGVGHVFEAFRNGTLEDDDEVALVHESASSGYRGLSIPMVNMRATLAAALSANIVAQEAHDALLKCAKALFYPDRSYPRLLAEGAAAGLGTAEIQALKAWLPTGQVDAKRADALAMLAAIAEHVGRPGEKTPPRFHFEHTTFWDGLRQSCDDAHAGEAPAAASRWRDVLDELRLQRNLFEETRLRAVNRAFARAFGEREGQRIEGERLSRAVEEFRRSRGLLDAGSLERWLAAHDLDPQNLTRFLQSEAVMRWAWSASDLERRVVDELKLTESYPELSSRALDKQAVLANAGLSEPGPTDASLSRDELIQWYFREVALQSLPKDLLRYVRDAGFGDEQLFLRAALREFLYRGLKPELSSSVASDQ